MKKLSIIVIAVLIAVLVFPLQLQAKELKGDTSTYVLLDNQGRPVMNDLYRESNDSYGRGVYHVTVIYKQNEISYAVIKTENGSKSIIDHPSIISTRMYESMMEYTNSNSN